MPFPGLKIRTEDASELGSELGPEFMAPDTVFADPLPADFPDDLPPVPPPPPRGGRRPTSPVPTVTRSMEKDVRDELEALCSMVALMVSVPDPTCGAALNDQSKAIAASLTQLLKRNPRLLATLRGAGWMGDWVGLFMALMPVVKAVSAHHLTPKPEQEETYSDGIDPTAPWSPEYPPYLPRGTGNPAAA
jgi:hypothetical protein